MNFHKNGIISSKGISDTAPLHDMKIKTLSDGGAWARIHWLDVTTDKTWFANASEVAKCTDKTNRYSRMGIVDLFKTSKGVYEFMLTYPSLSSTLYNRWSQTSSPNATAVTGFTAITTAWNAHNAGIRYHYNSEKTAFYDCDSGDTWFAAIGQVKSWGTQYIPAADGTSQTSTELWVRIDNLSRQTLLRIYDDSITSKDFIEL